MSQTDLHIRLIETTDQLVTFCKSAQTAPFLTVDTEFMREKTYFPQLCLVQVGTETEAVVVDALAPGIELQPLWDLLLNTPMPKVFHAASQDLEILHASLAPCQRPVRHSNRRHGRWDRGPSGL